jgi:acetyltransferase-like isoleucine patch superfamily enzyme
MTTHVFDGNIERFAKLQSERMGFANSLILKIKRGETPFYKTLGTIARGILYPRPPRLPRWMLPPFRLMYEVHYMVIRTWHTFWNIVYRGPMFQARCASFGKGVSVDRLPFVYGHVDIHIGDNVWIGGDVSITSGRLVDRPVLIVKDRAEIAWGVSIAVSKEVIIEEHARVSNGVRISDSDGHPREADLRAKNEPVRIRDIKPVRICKNAWIGNGTHIMKGVTIGEGAVIGANSVVISDIPPFSLALGNPAEVLFRNYGRPSKKPEVV